MLSEQALRTLAWNKILPPRTEGSMKCMCPHCGHTRIKRTRPTLRVYERPWGVHAHCFHCEWTADLPH